MFCYFENRRWRLYKKGGKGMLSKINSMALQGLYGYLVEVQVDVSNGMPCWEIVRFARY